jgi:beta-lactamase regulating signal transducer with metallopeptidase domain
MSGNALSISAAWTAAGWTMLHLVWIGVGVGLAAAIVRRLLRPARPEVRHGAAVVFLLGLTVAPAVLFAWLYRPAIAADPPIAPAGRVAAANGPATGVATPLPALDLSRSGDGPPAGQAPAPLSDRFEPLVGYLPGVWLSGSLATLALVATGLVGVERLRRSSQPLNADAIARRCRALADSLGIARRVGVAICDRLAAPVLVGIIRPTILLPAAALGGWGVEQLEMALLHELAHIRRHDNLITLLQRLAESLLFFHPVTWWLSGWVSLERELCCDRLVVEHTGRPQAYARMLAALAGVGPGPQSMALAMARHPLTTRIRRILDMEDRSMKMTLNEGLGLLAAAIAGTVMTLAAHARPPEPVPADAARQALERLARRIVALPDGFEDKKDASELYNGKGLALIEVAQSQLKLGDRAASLATLRLLDGLPEYSPPKPGAKPNLRSWERFAALAESVQVRREAGDLDGARAAVERADRQLEILDQGAVRGAIERVGKEVDAALAKKDEGLHRLNDEESAFISEASLFVIDEYIKLGDMTRARALIRRALETLGPPRGTVQTLMNAVLGGLLIKAGDPAGGRDLIEQVRRAAIAMPNPEARAFVLGGVVKKLSEAGEIDQALALVREMAPRAQRTALAEILLDLSTDDHRGAWFDPAGIAIKIGEPSAHPKDPASARVILPKIVATAQASGDAKVQARTLAVVAHLQARAGDADGALATARSIPDLKRSDFPGPSDGFYDAIKPVTFALIASAQAEAGDRSAAAAALGQAEALARAVAAEDQKLIAQIVIAQKNVTCGRRDVAKAIIAEAIAPAITQPEPRRSRVLTMLAEAQASADDINGALRTIEAIRAYPGPEKARALSTLARRLEETGDAKRSAELARRATAALEAKAPEKPLPGRVMTLNAIGHDTFIDYDLELRPEITAFHRNLMLQVFRTRMGEVEAAIREAKAAPAPGRDFTLSQLVGNLARNGDVARAMDLAEAIDSPNARIQAFTALASAIPDRRAKK